MSKEQEELTEKLQLECHGFIEKIIEISGKYDSKSYQDATNVWLFSKLAELQLKNQELESKIRSSGWDNVKLTGSSWQ